jgi:hypothetical protein
LTRQGLRLDRAGRRPRRARVSREAHLDLAIRFEFPAIGGRIPDEEVKTAVGGRLGGPKHLQVDALAG